MRGLIVRGDGGDEGEVVVVVEGFIVVVVADDNNGKETLVAAIEVELEALAVGDSEELLCCVDGDLGGSRG